MSVFSKLSSLKNWTLENPKHPKITTIDMHTGGEPLRIIIDGFPKLSGTNVINRRQIMKDKYDHLRTALMFEPRGHADMYGCVLLPANDDSDADFGVFFIHNEGYSTMCGHAIIALSTFVIETGLIEPTGEETVVKIDSPAGQITSYIKSDGKKVLNVRFHNVASYVEQLDAIVNVPEIGAVKYDLAYGGGYYAYVQAKDFGLKCTPEYTNQLIDIGMKIKRAVMASRDITHPFENDLNFLYGTIFIDKSESGKADSRNCCIFAEGEVDRSPTGTGVSGRMAIHYARGEIKIGEKMIIESILGSAFICSVIAETTYGKYQAVIPQVSGKAYFSGRCEFFIDPNDPLQKGFILR